MRSKQYLRRLLASNILLYSGFALASSVAINLVPRYAKSAPRAIAEATACPSPIDSDNITVPSNHFLTSLSKANGDNAPAWPPAPAQTKTHRPHLVQQPFFACLYANNIMIYKPAIAMSCLYNLSWRP